MGCPFFFFFFFFFWGGGATCIPRESQRFKTDGKSVRTEGETMFDAKILKALISLGRLG